MKRRTFIRLVGGSAAAGATGLDRLLADFKGSNDIVSRVAGLPRRVLGRTGQQVSIVGYPGLALFRENQEGANAAVKKAFERGVNYFDVAPAYGKDGECEIKMGVALQQLDRKQIFLACKTKARDKEGARTELERSLQRLKTDHFDLYQMHHLVTVEEVKRAFGPGGAIETFKAARDEGKIKWMGFSAHSTKAALAALESHAFDTVMFPVSFAEYYLRDFGKAVLEAAAGRGAAVLAIKALCMGAWPKDTPRAREWWYRTTESPEEIALALRFSLSLKGVVAAFTPSYQDLFDQAITAGCDYQTATTADMDRLRELARKCESVFITEDKRGDSTAQNHKSPYPHHPHECDAEAWA